MRPISTLGRRLAVDLLLVAAACTHAAAGELPIVPDVELDGDRLTWSPLEGATGYNIYGSGRYLTTVIDAFEFTLTEVGTYSVLGFNDAGDFTPLRGSTRVEFTGGVDNRPQVFELTEGFLYVTRRCPDVGAGESCTASCPDSVGSTDPTRFTRVRGATGGACSSTDTLPVNASIEPSGYTCTVSGFTSRVTTRAVCATEVVER